MSSRVFDRPAVDDVIQKTGLPLKARMKPEKLANRLEDLALQYYWAEFAPPKVEGKTGLITLDSATDGSVTPSRLRDRLRIIATAADRVVVGTSRKPFAERIEGLLDQLGYDKEGKARKYSGGDLPGHGGSERDAVWLCLATAVASSESAPRQVSPDRDDRPWHAERLKAEIQALARAVRCPVQGRTDAKKAARAIQQWADWSHREVARLVAREMARNRGDPALAATLLRLARLFEAAFGRKPSAYRRRSEGPDGEPNPWERFVLATIPRILAPEKPPPLETLIALWQRNRLKKKRKSTPET